MTKTPDANGVDHTQSSPREPARALLRASGKHGYRAEPDSPVLASAELGELNAEQLDGLTCAFCGDRDGAMVPISRGPELFIHAKECPSTPNQSNSAPNQGSLGIALDCLAEQCSIEQLAAAKAITEELEDEEASAQLGYLIQDKGPGPMRLLREQNNYSQRAAAAIIEAAGGEHDFGGWLGEVLATAAAELGSTAALTAGRPGSWEADLVQRLVRGTVGWEDEYLRDYRHAPPAIGENS
jgi:hypothetical protein